jgi:HRAS-like suppressor 3
MTKIKGKHIIAASDYYLPHHGIGISKDEVVCCVQLSLDTLDTRIVVKSIEDFLQRSQLVKVDYPYSVRPKDDIIESAVASIGIQPFDQDLLGDNFAFWCMTGQYLPIDSNIYGQHLRVQRDLGYYHHGIGIDNQLVVHYGDPSGGTSKSNAMVHATTFQEFSQGRYVEIVNYNDNNRQPLIVARNRAIATIGQNGYDLISNNCEHFATWCVSGFKLSKQVKEIEKSFSSGLKIGLSALLIGAFIGGAIGDEI